MKMGRVCPNSGGRWMRRWLLGFLIAFALTACSSTPATGSSLVGEWAPRSAEFGGEDFPVAGFGGSHLRLTADTYQFAGDKGIYAVLSTSPPSRMDIRGQEGPNTGRTIRAIFELSGDQLTVCYELGAEQRPLTFHSPKGSRVLVVHYDRVP